MAKKESSSTMKNEKGFSTIELLITLFIATTFIIVFYQLFVLISGISSNGYQNSVASNLAYANMRLYATSSSPSSWFTCSSSTDLKTYPTATGQVLLSGTATADLPPPVTQSVIATAPYGCSGTALGMPVKVDSTITYGPKNTTVSHSTYASY